MLRNNNIKLHIINAKKIKISDKRDKILAVKKKLISEIFLS